MIPNVVRGERMAGLMVYLGGGGRHNEHTEPHLVAGDAALMAWHAEAELNRDSALAIARHLDRPPSGGILLRSVHERRRVQPLRAESARTFRHQAACDRSWVRIPVGPRGTVGISFGMSWAGTLAMRGDRNGREQSRSGQSRGS